MAETKVVNLDVNTNLGSLKSQLKEAQREVEQLSAKFGATSTEATNAAKKAAELKDAIGDAKNLTDAFNPDAKFNALTASIGGVLNGFQAFEGALGLVGVEGEAVQATLLKVQSAMALSQGLQGLGEARDSFKALTAVIGQTAIGQKLLSAAQVVGATVMKALNFVMKQNPIFLIIAGITAAVAAFKYFTRAEDEATVATQELNRKQEDSIRLMKLSQKELDNYTNKLNESSKNKIALAKAEGANSEEIFQLEKSRLEEQIRYTDLMYKSGVKLTTDQYKAQKQAKFDLKLLEAQHKTEVGKIEEEKTAKQKEESNNRFVNEQKNLNDLIEQRYQASLKEQEARKNAKGFEDAENQKLAEIDNAEQAKKDAKKEQDKLDEQDLSAFKISLWEYEAAQQKDIDDKAKIKKEQDIKQSVDLVRNGFKLIGDLTELMGNRTSKERKKAFQIKKAADLAGATIDGTKATLSAYADTPGGPIIKGFAAGIAGGFAALQIAAIARTQYNEGGSGGSGSPSSLGGSSAASGSQAPNFNIIGNNGLNQLTQLQQKPVQAYVVSGEMSSQQALDRNRLRNATL